MQAGAPFFLVRRGLLRRFHCGRVDTGFYKCHQSFLRRGPTMAQTVAHFVFTGSGAGCLVQALRKVGRDDPVVATCHNMNIGPIDPSDPSSREKWFENELGRIDRKDGARSERDWDYARFPGHRKVAWLTRRFAMEYAGFLDWLWHRGDTPCDLVDLSEVEISCPRSSAHRRDRGLCPRVLLCFITTS